MDGVPPDDRRPRLPADPDRHEHELAHRLADAAIQAEFDTGVREDTVAEARAHVLVRVARMSLGFLVVALGVVLLPLPGPGWLVIAAGFAVLAKDVPWAERTLGNVRRRLPADSDGKIPTRTWVTIGAVTTCTVGTSVWWSFFR